MSFTLYLEAISALTSLISASSLHAMMMSSTYMATYMSLPFTVLTYMHVSEVHRVKPKLRSVSLISMLKLRGDCLRP